MTIDKPDMDFTINLDMPQLKARHASGKLTSNTVTRWAWIPEHLCQRQSVVSIYSSTFTAINARIT